MLNIPEDKRVELQVDTMTRFIGMMIDVAVSECGERILDQFEKAFYEMGTKLGNAIKTLLNLPPGDNDAIALSKIVDYADTIMGYKWEYLEKTPKKAVKKIPSCPLAKALSKGRGPVFCERFMTAWATALMRTINSKASCHFTHLIPKGDEYCLGHFEVAD